MTELYFIKTMSGLVPADEETELVFNKMHTGDSYVVEVREARSLPFHKWYFRILRKVWDNQSHKITDFFHRSFELFRHTVEIAAGSVYTVFNLKKRVWEEHRKSISFEEMSAREFSDLYDRVINVLLETFCEGKDENPQKRADEKHSNQEKLLRGFRKSKEEMKDEYEQQQKRREQYKLNKK